ncbi:5'-nucleotidase C-terminal domain-containing protein [Sulfitobacter aestuariivivens]|uniref:5'-nucleotidase C-terminal domain-containing protein n=1 Tax=Sulfitobacter aestuariivivens TaxID=2766981 RepID=UPI003610B7A1
MAASARAKRAFRAHLAKPVGTIDRDLHNYFSLAAPTGTGAFCADAKARRVRDALRGSAYANLPLLATASAHSAGGRDGPDNFLHIPKGPVLRRHLAGLDPYANRIWALRVTGRTLRRHLELAATAYTTLVPGQAAQNLLRNDIPAFNFDTIYGVTYQIDPSQPPHNRIASLCCNDRPVTDDQQFVLVTNQFRAAGGGGYDRITEDNIILRHPDRAETAFIKALAAPRDTVFDATPPWSFVPQSGVEAVFYTSPHALRYLDQIKPLEPASMACNSTGFARLRLTL